MKYSFFDVIPSSVAIGLTVSTLTIGTVTMKSVQAQNVNPEQMFIFGDSLSDGGNFFNISGGFPPEPFYVNGRFSNGPTWADYLAAEFGLIPTPFTAIPPSLIPADGINYAISGALSDNTNISPLDPNLPGLTQQLDDFTNRVEGQSTNPNALYTLWIGSNDYLQGALPSPPFPSVMPNPSNVVGNITTALTRLIDLGAENILVGNSPDLGQIPLASQYSPNNLTELSEQHNTLLNQSLQQLRQSNPGVNLFLFDAYSVVNQMISNPTSFGLENVTEGCTNINLFDNPPLPDPLVICNNPDGHLFWDNQHPTTAGHRILANEALNSLQVPEPSSILGFGLLGLGLLAGKLKNH